MDIRKILDVPFFYNMYHSLLGREKEIFAKEYIGDVDGLRVLDIGCGTADILQYLEGCSYVGIDIDSNYIQHAKRKYAGRENVRFLCMDLNDFIPKCRKKFDRVLMMGVIMNLSDKEAFQAMEGIRKLLSQEGKFLSYDSVYLKQNHWFANFLLDIDRGRHIRTVRGYRRLHEAFWGNVKYEVRKDIMRVPYSEIFFVNTNNPNSCKGTVRAEFDNVAGNYAQLMEKGMVLKGNSHEYFTSYKMRYLRPYIQHYQSKNLSRTVKILDYGCGVGTVSWAVAQSFQGVSVHGFDISRESIKYASSQEGMPGSVRFTSTVDSLDNDYDICICCCVLHHVPAEERILVIRNIYHRLRRGGVLIVIEHNMKNPLTRKSVDSCPFDKKAVMLTQDEVIRLMAQGNLKQLSKRYITFFPKQLSCLRFLDHAIGWCMLGAQHMEAGYKGLGL